MSLITHYPSPSLDQKAIVQANKHAVKDHELETTHSTFQFEIDFQILPMNNPVIDALIVVVIAALNSWGCVMRLKSTNPFVCDDGWKDGLQQILLQTISQEVYYCCIRLSSDTDIMYLLVKRSHELVTYHSHLYWMNFGNIILLRDPTVLRRVITSVDNIEYDINNVMHIYVPYTYGDDITFKPEEHVLLTSMQGNKFVDENLALQFASACANSTIGGYMYLGITPNKLDRHTGTIEGVHVNTDELASYIQQLFANDHLCIWGDGGPVPVHGKQWSIQYTPISFMKYSRQMCVVRIFICRCRGGMHTKCPESFYLSPDGQVCKMTLSQWRQKLLSDSSKSSDPIEKETNISDMYISPSIYNQTSSRISFKRALEFVMQEIASGNPMLISLKDLDWRKMDIEYKPVKHDLMDIWLTLDTRFGLNLWTIGEQRPKPDVQSGILAYARYLGVHLTSTLRRSDFIRTMHITCKQHIFFEGLMKSVVQTYMYPQNNEEQLSERFNKYQAKHFPFLWRALKQCLR